MIVEKRNLEKLKNQFCIDYNCKMQDFDKPQNIITPMAYHRKRRRYTDYDPMFRMVSFYDKILATAAPPFYEWAMERYRDCFSGWVFSMEEVRAMNAVLAAENQYIADLHHYYLPLMDFPVSGFQKEPQTDERLVWLGQEEIELFRDSGMYEKAFAFNRFHPDVIGLLALDRKLPPKNVQEQKLGGRIMGAAGASADGEDLWQIGINVNPAYRGRGIAVMLVTILKQEILRQGKVPFYGTVESHNLSNSVAIRAGFFPVFSELRSGPIHL